MEADFSLPSSYAEEAVVSPDLPQEGFLTIGDVADEAFDEFLLKALGLSGKPDGYRIADGNKSDLAAFFSAEYRRTHPEVTSVAFIGGSNHIAEAIFNGDMNALANEVISRPTSPSSPFKAAEQEVINRSLDNSRTMLLQTAAEIKRWNNSDENNFYNAFGITSEDARNVIFTRINNLIDLNSKMTIDNFKVAPRLLDMSEIQFSNIFAYVYANDSSHTVYVGPRFWSAPEAGLDSTAGTLIHEISHFVGTGPAIPGSSPPIYRTLDGYLDSTKGVPAVHGQGRDAGTPISVYGRDESNLLSPSQALYHADSFEYYLEHTSLPRPQAPNKRK